MFEFVRKHTKIMMFVMFLLIIPSFVLFGMDGYTQYRENGQAVARVNGADITQAEWDTVHKGEVERIRAQRPEIDVKLLDTPEARYASLERIVRDRVLLVAVDKLKLQTSDIRLARELQQDPTIASLRLPDGTLDKERYKQLVAAQGLTPEGFEARVRRDLSLAQVQGAIANSGFSSPKQANVSLGAYFERRNIQFVRSAPGDFVAKVTPSDADLDAYYKANPTQFKAAETANIEYVVLDLEAVKKSIALNEADLRTYYDQNQARLSGAQERRASHILINAAKDAPAADREKAKARATELLASVRAAPANFAEIAKKNSQDTGSAPAGGDLDFFSRGAMVKPFEDAAFAMKKGDISEVVESDFGYHIIQLTDIKEPVKKSFDELRASMEGDLKAQQARVKYAELAEVLTNIVYEQSDSLKPAADRLKLDIKTATGVTRQALPGATGVLANAKLLAAIFSTDSIEKKRNTEAVEAGGSQMVAARITQHLPAKTLDFADVRSVVKDRVIAQKALELARKDGEDKLAALKASATAASSTVVFPAAATVSRDQPLNTPPQVLDAALRADTSVLPLLMGVDLGPQGYAIVRIISAVARPAPPEAIAKQEQVQYAQGWSNAESLAYYSLLKERYKAQILVPKPVRAPAGSSQVAS